jgi:hypothetical protein
MNNRYIPKGSTERRFDDIPAVAYLYQNKDGKPAAVVYSGRRSKPDWHFRFQDDERREKKIKEWIDELKKHAEYKAEQKEKMKGHPSSHAQGSANLKADLETNFPGVKFSVKSKSFSMGDSIDASWTDGPTYQQVDLIARTYQEGHFDGMTDMYEYDNTKKFEKGSAKYVFCSRRESPALILKAAKLLNYNIPAGESDRSGCLPGLDWEQSQEVYRQARTMAVVAGKVKNTIKLVTAHTKTKTRPVDPVKLRTLADGMEKAIDGKFNSGVSQQNPTRRRLAIAEGMRRDGEQLQKVQFLLRVLADLHEAGIIPLELAYITTKTAAHTALFGYQDKIQAAIDIANGKPPEDPKAKILRDLDRELIGCKIPGFFITPKDVAAQVVELADIREGMEVLEPEAGRGDIAEHINHGSHLTCIEYQQRLAKILELRGFSVICGDFLEHTGQYDRIVQNSPFENNQSIEHTKHAYQCLKPEGRMVSIVCESAFFKNDKTAIAFREWLEEKNAEIIDLPAGAFAGTITSTGAKARIVIIDKD